MLIDSSCCIDFVEAFGVGSSVLAGAFEFGCLLFFSVLCFFGFRKGSCVYGVNSLLQEFFPDE